MKVSIQTMRERLVPFNPSAADIIKLRFHSNYGYVHSKEVYDALDVLEKKLIAVAAGVDQITPLERLAIMLLADSADMLQEEQL